MSPLHQLRDELAARLERTRRRKHFDVSGTARDIERSLDAAERAIVAAAFGDTQHVESALHAVSPWLRSAHWHAARGERSACAELAAVWS